MIVGRPAMKRIEVIVRDKNTLILKENAEAGDYIDLSSLSSVDFSTIEELIESGKDRILKEKIEEFRQSARKESDWSLKENDRKWEKKIEEKEKDYREQLHALQTEIDRFELKKELEIDRLRQQLNEEKNSIAESKRKEIEELRKQSEFAKKEFDLKKENWNTEKELALNNLKADYEKKLSEKENAYQLLQRQKAALNVKQTGEDLESWCNNEVLSYMQNGLQNCTWKKDNDVVKESDEFKGSKADFIFRVYASPKHCEEEELTSVCLDMKDENPNSVNRKKNADYYKELDKNRSKKKCRYALLVSNLEMDKPNDLPIFKVNEYENMYVVRPGYMMTFLNMIASLSMRFSDLILEEVKSNLEVKSQEELLEEFERIKTTYLDKPLENLKNQVESIKKNSEAIIAASGKIQESCDKIIRNYIENIENKIATFDAKVKREYRKYEEKVKI